MALISGQGVLFRFQLHLHHSLITTNLRWSTLARSLTRSGLRAVPNVLNLSIRWPCMRWRCLCILRMPARSVIFRFLLRRRLTACSKATPAGNIRFFLNFFCSIDVYPSLSESKPQGLSYNKPCRLGWTHEQSSDSLWRFLKARSPQVCNMYVIDWTPNTSALTRRWALFKSSCAFAGNSNDTRRSCARRHNTMWHRQWKLCWVLTISRLSLSFWVYHQSETGLHIPGIGS
jgi:hypothetical protein